MNDELTQNVTGWLYNLLKTPGAVTIDSSQADYVVQAKKWLADVNTGRLEVLPAEEPSSSE